MIKLLSRKLCQTLTVTYKSRSDGTTRLRAVKKMKYFRFRTKECELAISAVVHIFAYSNLIPCRAGSLVMCAAAPKRCLQAEWTVSRFSMWRKWLRRLEPRLSLRQHGSPELELFFRIQLTPVAFIDASKLNVKLTLHCRGFLNFLYIDKAN